MTQHATNRPVFVSYSRDDTDRTAKLVDALTDEGLAVFWDENIGGGERWRDVIPDAIHKAAAVTVLWTKASVNSSFVLEEASLGNDLNMLIPIMFEGGVEVPRDFGEIQCLDLAGWNGESSPQFTRLVATLRTAVEHRKRGVYCQTAPWNDASFADAMQATSELQQLTGTVREVGEILAVDRPVVSEITSALKEVNDTYEAVRNAVEEFLAPAFESGTIDGKPYMRMEDGRLEETIKTGRGHCTSILTLYRRHRGLRDSVRKRVDVDKLQEVDAAFDALSTADGDLFERLSNIGWMLTAESETIARMLVMRRTELARDRIRNNHQKIKPFRKFLAAAIDELQQVQQSLGYAKKSDDSPT